MNLQQWFYKKAYTMGNPAVLNPQTPAPEGDQQPGLFTGSLQPTGLVQNKPLFTYPQDAMTLTQQQPGTVPTSMVPPANATRSVAQNGAINAGGPNGIQASNVTDYKALKEHYSPSALAFGRRMR